VAWARTLEREATGDTVLHAVWASLPATVALSVHRLTGLPFSFSGHAYDLFEDGGDALLEEKVAAAFALRTTTEAGARRFREAGASEAQLVVIRRGFSAMPAFSPSDGPHGTLRIAVVGRFVPKMGYRLLAEVFDHLAVQSFSFEAKIVGDGPERDAFAEGQSRSGWATNVELLGAVPFATVLETLRWADVLLFTGEVAESGDQAGFPNILGEAMAIGCPVVATPVGGVGEVIVDRKNGQLASHASEFHAALVRLTSAPKKVRDEVLEARKWVENEFDAHRNMAHFWEFLEKNTPGF
jgi:glycosyltransferase involved in cell wall biosynthesis